MPRNQTVVKRYALAIQVKAVTTTEEEERVVGGPRLSPHIESARTCCWTPPANGRRSTRS